jgi:hypothetical protein
MLGKFRIDVLQTFSEKTRNGFRVFPKMFGELGYGISRNILDAACSSKILRFPRHYLLQ